METKVSTHNDGRPVVREIRRVQTILELILGPCPGFCGSTLVNGFCCSKDQSGTLSLVFKLMLTRLMTKVVANIQPRELSVTFEFENLCQMP